MPGFLFLSPSFHISSLPSKYDSGDLSRVIATAMTTKINVVEDICSVPVICPLHGSSHLVLVLWADTMNDPFYR